MKQLPRLLLTALLTATAATPSLHAKLPPPPPPPLEKPSPPAPPVAPPSDPFVRNSARTKPALPIPKKREGAPVNLLTTIETWSLSQADFVTLLDGPADEGAPYARVEELAKTGKAKLLGLVALTTTSGHRAVVEVIDEIRYGSTFQPAERAGEFAVPTKWETRNAGNTLEVEPTLLPDEKAIAITLVPQVVQLDGFEDSPSEGVSSPIGQPKFRTEKVTTKATVQSGRPIMLSTATSAANAVPKGSKEVRVRFLRVVAQAVPSPAAADPNVGNLRIEFLLYNLDLAAARRLLVENGDSAKSYAALRAMVAKGDAELSEVCAFGAESGARIVSEEIAEKRYRSDDSFETRNTGITVEVEAVSDGRFVDINVVPQMVEFVRMLKPEGVAAKYPPQPLFATRKLTTTATSGLGVPVFLGTLSKLHDNGVNDTPDDGRTSLAYIRVTPVRP